MGPYHAWFFWTVTSHLTMSLDIFLHPHRETFLILSQSVTCFIVWLHRSWHSHQHWVRVQPLSSWPPWGTASCLHFSGSGREVVSSHCNLKFISWTNNESEHFRIWSCLIWSSGILLCKVYCFSVWPTVFYWVVTIIIVIINITLYVFNHYFNNV